MLTHSLGTLAAFKRGSVYCVYDGALLPTFDRYLHPHINQTEAAVAKSKLAS